MKISLLQTPMFPLNLKVCAGVERVELEEADGLIKKGHQVTLTVPEVIDGINKRPDWIKVINDWGWENRLVKWKYLLQFVSKNKNADILHGHYTTGLPLLAPDKTFVHFHGFALGELPLYRHGFAKKRYHRAHYIFCAKHLIETFKKRYPEIPVEHLYLLYNGIDVGKFTPKTKKGGDGKIRFSFHGRWVEHKGIRSLLKAVAILENKRADFECHIAGSSTMAGLSDKDQTFANDMKGVAQKLKTVKLVGAITYDEMPGFLNEMDFGVVPSIYPDPFPLAPLEIMACGLPVIAFDIGGLKEMIVNNKNGLLVENMNSEKLAEAIDILIENKQKRNEMGVMARKRVLADFTWEKHIDALSNIYNTISEKII